MAYRHDNFDDTWSGLEPEQPDDQSSWLFWLAIGGGLIVILCFCAIGTFFAVRQLLVTPAPPQILEVPTQPAVEATLPGEATIDAPTALPPPPTPPVFPTSTPDVAATITLPGQATAIIPDAGNVIAVQMPTPPTIDGLLNEWDGVTSVSSSFRVFQISTWDGTDDLTASWRLAWDLNHLYVGVEVIDDIHVQTQTGNQIFRGDSVDMQFDTNREADFGNGLSPDDFQITFSPGDYASLPESAFRFQGTANGQILDAPGGHHITLKAQQTESGYTVEAAIPWGDLDLTPSAGLVIGIALNANDNDSPGTAAQEVMMSHVATRTLTDPSGWGTLTLQ